MNLAFLLLVHRDPLLVGRLVDRLEGDVLIHVDAKCEEAPFRAAAPMARFVEDSRPVHHGGFSMVEATIAGMRAAQSLEYDYLILLSGQHYPIKPLATLREYLLLQGGRSVMRWFRLPYDGWFNGGLDRIEEWYFYDLSPKVRSRVQRVNRLPVPKRRLPGGIAAYGGSQWFVMHREHVAAVLARVARQPRLMRFFRHVKIPDEIFFQTVLMDEVGPERVLDRDLTYVDWTKPVRPAPITESHFSRLAAGQEFFARKFDTSSVPLLDRIDTELLSPTGTSGSQPPRALDQPGPDQQELLPGE